MRRKSTTERAGSSIGPARNARLKRDVPLAVLVAVALVASLTASGCDRDSGAQSDAQKKREQTAGERGDWRRVSSDELEEAAQSKLGRARSAVKSLGSQLKKELQGSISEKSFSGAVEFCHGRAPELAREVGKENDVEIGRTSHRLRNADNTPPDWAREAVEDREARKYVFRGPDEKLGYLHPIELQGLCVNCHGSTDQLAPGVEAALQEHYPDDRATGFEVGDLRGWFWVEVPRDT